MSIAGEPEIAKSIPDKALALCKALRDAGYRSWIVGGSVRDLLRGAPAKDWDIATAATPEQVTRTFRKVIPTGIEHGTVTVLMGKTPYEVTTLRGEGAYTDGRHPDEVHFVSDITEDLRRRDFTFNAIAFDPVEGALIDPFEGRKDLAQGIVKAVGDPRERFTEDGLRILRGARFAATLGFSLDPATERAMGEADVLATFKKVSAERIREEWIKAVHAVRPSIAFEIMKDTGMLPIICPEIMDCIGCEQNRYHAYDVWGHTMAALDACTAGPVVRIAALFHDIGKPRTRELSDKTKDYTFYDHERVGAEMAEPILSRLKFSNDDKARIVGLVRHHLICYTPSWSDAAVRRWIRRVSPELADDLYALGRADAAGKGLDASEDVRNIDELQTRVAEVLAAGQALSTRDLAIGGKDLMRELELRPGPVIGKILSALLEIVLDDPTQNEPDLLIGQARRLADELGAGAESPPNASSPPK